MLRSCLLRDSKRKARLKFIMSISHTWYLKLSNFNANSFNLNQLRHFVINRDYRALQIICQLRCMLNVFVCLGCYQWIFIMHCNFSGSCLGLRHSGDGGDGETVQFSLYPGGWSEKVILSLFCLICSSLLSLYTLDFIITDIKGGIQFTVAKSENCIVVQVHFFLLNLFYFQIVGRWPRWKYWDWYSQKCPGGQN